MYNFRLLTPVYHATEMTPQVLCLKFRLSEVRLKCVDMRLSRGRGDCELPRPPPPPRPAPAPGRGDLSKECVEAVRSPDSCSSTSLTPCVSLGGRDTVRSVRARFAAGADSERERDRDTVRVKCASRVSDMSTPANVINKPLINDTGNTIT
ncbi:hypothetical protein RR48_04555 [Papilio machaon]|uniref:Uncharacterized protein n=1 Tax=Papilio machaon TaxID=76193 RepID=A0A0N1I5Y3_PAPMA|nr:hypothetical protein RR48_04555 [Papilio machaon]